MLSFIGMIMSLASLTMIEFSITVGVVIVFSVIGFCFGMLSERWTSAHALKKAASDFQKSIEQTLVRLDKAQKACVQLESFPDEKLPAEVQQSLEKHRGGLLGSLTRLIRGNDFKSNSVENQEAEKETEEKPVELEWVSTPVDTRSLLPDQIALDENLLRLVSTVSDSESASLLIVQIDRFESLIQRFGDDEKNHLLRSMAKLLVRLIREKDLVCHCCDDLFTILIPKTDFNQGVELADHIRQSTRAHRFRLSDVSREVLMTASFGFYNISQGDNADLAFNRAMDALSHSKRKGRNQLHYHDGQSVNVFHSQPKSQSLSG